MNSKNFSTMAFTLCFGFVTLISCGGGSDPQPQPSSTVLEVNRVTISDVANFGDGRDLQVSFDEITSEGLLAYRIIVVKGENSSSFDLDAALALETNTYKSVLPSDYQAEIVLDNSTLDSEGELITESQSYIVFVATIVDDDNEGGITASDAITLAQTNLVNTLEGGFSASGGIVLGDDGTIYIADFGTGSSNGTTILKFNATGQFIETFADGLLGPTGGAFDSDGNLYWSSYSASKVHKIDALGHVSDFVDIPGPVAIAVDDSDNLFIASCDGNDIKKVTTDGTVTTFATSSSFNCINGLTITETGELYGCNFEDGQIFKITTDGTVSTFATIPSGSSGNMTYHDGSLYVTGREAHRIYIVDVSTGAVETFAGTGIRGNKDGAALDSQFSFPNGIQITKDGSKIYVNDVAPSSSSFNPNTLRVIELIE